MPRPQKLGLDYFPLDTNMDDKLELIEAKYDLIGYAIVLKLWTKIYLNSYWYNWTDKEILLFRKQNNIELNLLNDIINQCLEWDIFDLDLYKQYRILTSNGIQKRYLHAISTRKNQEFVEEYCLFDLNDYINSVKDSVNVVKVSLNTHTILKDTKLNHIKPNKRKETAKPETALPQFAIDLSKTIFNNSSVTPTEHQINTGAKVIADIEHLDNYDEQDIISTIMWALENDFWKGVVQSPAGLRKKKNGPADITKFAKIYNQWKNKPLTDKELAQQAIDRSNEFQRQREEGK